MPRLRGSGSHGCVRALRLPQDLDEWFDARLNSGTSTSASDLLGALVSGGKSLRSDRHVRHRRSLARLRLEGNRSAYEAYLCALDDAYGPETLDELADASLEDALAEFAGALDQHEKQKPR